LAASAPPLGAAESFAVLAGTAVTCTASIVTGDVGVYPGTAITQTEGCRIDGNLHPGDDVAKAVSRFLAAPTHSRTTQSIQSPSVPALILSTPTTLTLPGVTATRRTHVHRTTLTLDAQGDRTLSGSSRSDRRDRCPTAPTSGGHGREGSSERVLRTASRLVHGFVLLEISSRVWSPLPMGA
jgi:hypothetical protein